MAGSIFIIAILILFSLNEENIKIRKNNKQEEIIKSIIYEDMGIKAVDILKIYNLAEDKVVMLQYEAEGKSYEGFYQLTRNNEIIKRALYEESQEEIFSFNCLSGRTESTGENYLILGGRVYSPKIKSIGITFEDNTLVNLIIGEGRTYSHIIKKSIYEIKKVEAFDEEYKVYKSKNI